MELLTHQDSSHHPTTPWKFLDHQIEPQKTHRIHVRCIYQHLVDLYGKCRLDIPYMYPMGTKKKPVFFPAKLGFRGWVRYPTPVVILSAFFDI